jgi:hypothetical protein
MRPALFFSQAGTTLVGIFHPVLKMDGSVIPVGTLFGQSLAFAY